MIEDFGEVLSPPITHTSDFKARALKQARERLDKTAHDNGISWLLVQQVALKLTGKSKGLTIGECNKVMQEVRRMRK